MFLYQGEVDCQKLNRHTTTLAMCYVNLILGSILYISLFTGSYDTNNIKKLIETVFSLTEINGLH